MDLEKRVEELEKEVQELKNKQSSMQVVLEISSNNGVGEYLLRCLALYNKEMTKTSRPSRSYMY